MPASRPLLLGHRGARVPSIPENTVAAFDLCLESGCDGFEFDVRRTADGNAIVCHDPVFSGIELREARLNDFADARAGGLLPTLDEVLARYASRCFLDIELKDPYLESNVLDCLRRHPSQRGVVVSSFIPEVLLALRELDRSIPLGYIFDEGGKMAEAFSLPIQYMMPQQRLTDDHLIERAHSRNLKVFAWTLNEPAEMLQLSNAGIDALISDNPSLLFSTVRSRGAHRH